MTDGPIILMCVGVGLIVLAAIVYLVMTYPRAAKGKANG